jgi:alginate O-acetyltransferase complex protein AlgI
MLFNSYPFVFLFLPLAWLLFFHVGGTNRRLAAAWLALASLLFYAWWNPTYVALLLGSVVFNFLFGAQIARFRASGYARRAWLLLAIAVIANLGLLAYYKYANFFLSAWDQMTRADWQLSPILLPIGISFFTFTQIAFLVDTYRGLVTEYKFVHYMLFVTYFPHLIAGPVLHHKEMMPQFSAASTYRHTYGNLAIGLTMFVLGLAKKVLLADNLVDYVRPVYDGPAGHIVTAIDGWGATLAYALELYFDFSGYSDMAIGLSLMFNVRLPANFNSPYKALNIVDFWRRWHMTLSRFLRDYLYFPLGGNRKGPVRRYVNLLVTMLLGGLWHGAGWNFLIWGGLHGIYLMLNHAWLTLRQSLGIGSHQSTPASRALARVITFLAVTVAWVFFRASNLDEAFGILKGMAGLNGIVLPVSWLPKLGGIGSWLSSHDVQFVQNLTFGGSRQVAWIAALMGIAWFMPNTQQLLARYAPVLEGTEGERANFSPRLAWQPGVVWALAIGVIGFVALSNISKPHVFLYFQF